VCTILCSVCGDATLPTLTHTSVRRGSCMSGRRSATWRLVTTLYDHSVASPVVPVSRSSASLHARLRTAAVPMLHLHHQSPRCHHLRVRLTDGRLKSLTTSLQLCYLRTLPLPLLPLLLSLAVCCLRSLITFYIVLHRIARGSRET